MLAQVRCERSVLLSLRPVPKAQPFPVVLELVTLIPEPVPQTTAPAAVAASTHSACSMAIDTDAVEQDEGLIANMIRAAQEVAEERAEYEQKLIDSHAVVTDGEALLEEWIIERGGFLVACRIFSAWASENTNYCCSIVARIALHAWLWHIKTALTDLDNPAVGFDTCEQCRQVLDESWARGRSSCANLVGEWLCSQCASQQSDESDVETEGSSAAAEDDDEALLCRAVLCDDSLELLNGLDRARAERARAWMRVVLRLVPNCSRPEVARECARHLWNAAEALLLDEDRQLAQLREVCMAFATSPT